MLNSHMKSHSAHYEYRCMDCSYETKYTHSLRQHLSKHNHRPGKVLNSNGEEEEWTWSEYGMKRRMPKVKRPQFDDQQSQEDHLGSQEVSACDQQIELDSSNTER